ncbi:MAG: radical SAM protein [Candidatus Lokiarchaeota archaeon]|nr:radical SAM protein [Candidatus Lokiarchaeota archaeon]MBD3339293.1 radical SAM protein [Candidatus Lokiarchaeota archaeon]
MKGGSGYINIHNAENLLKKIKVKEATYSDFSNLLTLEETKIEPFFQLAQEIKVQNFGNSLKIYIPNKRFPAISLTGNICELNCEHCNKKYLSGMKAILNPRDLRDFLTNHGKKNGVGVLLSGGCDSNGSVPLIKYLDVVNEVKKETNLVINTHTGLLDENTAKKLAEANVDIVSFDINVDDDAIKEIYHLNKDRKDYERAVYLLKKYNLNVVPHICIGLYHGILHKELEALKFINETNLNPSLIVLIALIPPKYKKSKFKEPKPLEIAKIIAVTRFLFPTTEISLGCMRPRGKLKKKIELMAIKAGLNRIEIPSPDTLKKIKKINPKIKYKFFSACCALPKKFEELPSSKCKNSKIKRYKIN